MGLGEIIIQIKIKSKIAELPVTMRINRKKLAEGIKNVEIREWL